MATKTRDETVAYSLTSLIQARFTWIIFTASAVYVFLAVMLPNTWLAEILRCVQMTLSLIVLLGYFHSAMRCFFVVGRWPEKASVIALGIWISWFSIYCNSSWALLYRLSGQPAWMINNDIYTAWTAASSIAASLHIFAPNLIGEAVPKLDKIRFSVAAVFGMTLAVIVGFWRPDLSWVASWLHDFLAEPDWARRGLLYGIFSLAPRWFHA